MLAGRPHEAAGNGSPRWMAVGPRKRAHRTRPTGRLTPTYTSSPATVSVVSGRPAHQCRCPASVSSPTTSASVISIARTAAAQPSRRLGTRRLYWNPAEVNPVRPAPGVWVARGPMSGHVYPEPPHLGRSPDSVVAPRSGPVLKHPRDPPGQAEPGVSDGDGHKARPEIETNWAVNFVPLTLSCGLSGFVARGSAGAAAWA